MLYGSELWSLTKSDLNMLERTHRKILRTIQGLPTRCPSLALTSLIGSLGISSLVDCRQLCFVNSIACMSSEDLPKRVMLERLLADSPSGLQKTWSTLVTTRCYPSLSSMISNGKMKESFKAAAKKSMLICQYINMTDSCSNLPISSLPAHLGRPSLLWSCCLTDRSLHGPSNFRVRLLVGCDGLELDASRFRYRTNPNISPGDATCKLCNNEEEHFLVSCSTLSPRRNELLQDAPACVKAHLPHDSEASTS